MATFISLLNFTDQGIRNVKDSPDRYEEFRKMAEEKGGKVYKCLLDGRTLRRSSDFGGARRSRYSCITEAGDTW